MTDIRFQKLKHTLDTRQPDLTVLMQDVHKPRNFAAILRNCDAVGIFQTHAIAPDGLPFNQPKAAAGSRRWVKTKRHLDIEQAYSHLREHGFRIAVAHPSDNAIHFREYDYTQKVALVMGSELRGLDEQAMALADDMIAIPMHGFVQSLNVSVTAGLMMYEAERQRMAAGMYETSRMDSQTYHDTLFDWVHPQIAHFCRNKNVAYPEMNIETGEIIGEVPRS